MYPILGRYGSLFIYSYTVVMALGVIIAAGLIWRSIRYKPAPNWFDALLVMLVAGLVGGRIGFVFWRWDYFQEYPLEAWQIWQGGLSYQPALLAAILALAAWTSLNQRSFYRYAAVFAPAFLLATIFGWLACWFDGCAYGQETTIGYLSAVLPDEYGVFAVRYQTQLIGVLLTFTAFLFILWYQNKKSDPFIFFMALALVSTVHLLAGLLRGDPTVQAGPVRLDSLLNGLLAIISLLLLQYVWLKNKRTKANS